MTWIAYLLALASGAANPLQSGTNAQLNKQLGSPVWAGIAVYLTGLLGLLLVQLFLREHLPSASRIHSTSWWAWFGGFVSIFATMAGLTLAQRLGSGIFTGLTLTASILTSVILDHLGWVGFQQHTATPLRLLGCSLLVASVWLVVRF